MARIIVVWADIWKDRQGVQTDEPIGQLIGGQMNWRTARLTDWRKGQREGGRTDRLTDKRVYSEIIWKDSNWPLMKELLGNFELRPFVPLTLLMTVLPRNKILFLLMKFRQKDCYRGTLTDASFSWPTWLLLFCCSVIIIIYKTGYLKLGGEVLQKNHL
jgi:hypothetical protein